MNKYQFTEKQAKAILAMRLSSLAKLEKVELNNEKAELENSLKEWGSILENENKQIDIIKTRLSDLVKKYGDKRRTELAQIEVPKEDKEIAEVVPEDVVVITTKSGLIKRIPAAAFKVQRRGGKGIKSTDDIILSTVRTNTVDHMIFFSSEGKMYRTIVDNIPVGDNKTKGMPINNLIELSPNEKIIAVTSLHRKTTPEFVIFVTKNGKVKKTLLTEYFGGRATKKGIKAISLQEGDSIASINFQDKEDLIIVTKKGFGIRIDTSKISPAGRVTQGVKGIKLNEGDEVIAALPVHKETDTIGIFSAAGLGKRIEVKEAVLQGRGGKGVAYYKPTDETGDVIAIAMLSEEDKVLISGNKSSICISAEEIPITGRTAVGNILIKNNRVMSVSKV
jgi:DNA gyrase subunit A